MSESEIGNTEERDFHLELHDGVAIVVFLDIQIGPDARDQLYALVDEQHITRMVLDLSDVWALSSYALGILANLQKKVNQAGGRMRLCGLNANINQLFRLTKFDQIFDLHPDRASAMTGF